MDTNTDQFTPLTLRVWGNIGCDCTNGSALPKAHLSIL